MLAYQLRIAWLSLRRNPVLSVMLVGGIALGIAVATAFVTTYYLMASDPIPEKSKQLFYVQMDAWDPDSPFDDGRPEQPPDQLTYGDALAAMDSDVPTFTSPMFKAHLTVHPANPRERPFRAYSRLCFGDFFRMFDVPFQYGGPWDDGADQNAETVVVLDHETNLRMFGGEDSIGRVVRIEDRDFTVTGVMAPWQPSVRFYDVTQGAFSTPESVFIPFRLVEPMEIRSSGNDHGWKFYPGNEFADFLASEATWVQAWVQLEDEAQKDAYLAYLDAYALEQRKIGRFVRPLNNRLRDVSDWMEDQQVVPDQAKAMLIIALLFLVVCSVNLIGILLGKFLARAPEIGVRRALGATKGDIVRYFLVENWMVTSFGLLLGIGLTYGLNVGLVSFAGAPKMPWRLIAIGMIMLWSTGLLAALAPAWRATRVAPEVATRTV